VPFEQRAFWLVTIEEFIRTKIETVDNLRVLLVLQSEPQTLWDAVTVSDRLQLRPDVATRVLEDLAAKGLIEVSSGPHYRYGPRWPEFEPLVEQLAQIDREHPVSLINLIYARPEDVKAFAEVFQRKGAQANPMSPP
jgi:hypothetical protein